MFFTLEDPRAKIQGSRDPLGVQPIWAAFGRRLVTNLTTVTTSVRGFTVLLLGRYVGQRLIEENAIRPQDALSVFLRIEQIAAYARHKGHGVEGDIRGIERVKRALAEPGDKVLINDGPSGMILSDQKTYGLWGLYSVAARVSGLIPDGPVGVTPRAREFVERNYWPRLRPVEDELLRLAAKDGKLRTSLSDRLFRAVVSVLPERLTAPERDFYGATLRDARFVDAEGQPNRQALLAGLLNEHADLDAWIDRTTVLALAKLARPVDTGLAERLLKIARLEATLAPAETIFDHLQTRQGQTPRDCAAALAETWERGVPNLDADAFSALLPEIESAVGPELCAAIEPCDAAMAGGKYEAAITALLDWNRLVMQGRNAAPWVRIQGGKLDVRYRSVEGVLPAADELPVLWINSYFLDALREITRQTRDPDR